MVARQTETGGEDSPRARAADSMAQERERIWRARQRDPQAFAELVRLHQDDVYSLVRRMIRDDQLAEELTQDVFLRAWRNLPGFRGDSRFATWLYRIAINLCQDYKQSRVAQHRRRETDLESPELRQQESRGLVRRPDEVQAEEEVASLFEKSLDALEPPYLAAFLLYHQQGLSMEEVAGAMGISRGNAKVRVHRAREMILDSLRRQGFDV